MLKFNRILALMMSICIVISLVQILAFAAGPYDNSAQMSSGASIDTPEENIFQIEGNDQSFIMLDIGDSNESKFFVMSKSHYGNMQFDPDFTQKFDPSDPNNIAYQLNNEFLTREDNGLPKEMIKYINKNHVWSTEAGHAEGNCPAEYDTVCGISLMSFSEFVKYNGMYGVKDNFHAGWWLRTARGLGGGARAGFAVRVTDDMLGYVFEYGTEGEELIRPVFYLNKDFFKNVRVNTETLGKKVKEKLLKAYAAEDLTGSPAGYGNHELRSMGFKVDGIDEIASVTFYGAPSNVMDVSNAGFDVQMSITGSEDITYDVEYTLDDQSFKDTMTVKPNKPVTKKITYQNPKKGVYTAKVVVKNGNSVIKRVESKIGIMELYKPQFMDKYDRSIMATHFLFGEQTDKIELDLIKATGTLAHRDEIYWDMVEPKPGVWDFSKSDVYMNWVKDSDMDSYIIVDFSNLNYVAVPPGTSDPGKVAPRTKAELDAFCNYVEQILRRYPNIVGIEIWNETNWGFWQPEPNMLDYATMVKRVCMTARKVNPDIIVMAGSFVYIVGMDFFYDLLDENVFPYVDAMSTHPYVYPLNVDPALPNRLKTGVEVFDKFGGFKDHYDSEVGLPTSQNNTGIDEKGQAIALTKTFIYDEAYGLEATCWYNFRNKGTNPMDNEHNFGIINRDYTPKLALAALSQRNNRLNGSIYQGQVNLGNGVQAHLYSKDGNPLLVAWKESGTLNVSIPNSKVEDIYGNELAKSDVVELTESPKYIFNISRDYYAKAVAYTASRYYDVFLKNWKDVYENNALSELKSDAEGLSALPEATVAAAYLRKNYQIGVDIINKVKSGDLKISDKQMMSMLNDLYRAHIQWSNLYAAVGGSLDRTAISSQYGLVRQKIDQKTSVDYYATMYVSQELLRHAIKSNTRINDISQMGANNGKNAAISYYTSLLDMFSGWANLISDFEKVDENTAVITYVDQGKTTVYQGETKEIEVTVDNFKRNDLNNITAAVVDEKGEVVSETAQFSIKSGKTSVFKAKVAAPSNKIRGNYKYALELRKDGEVISKKGLYVKVEGIVDISLIPAKKSLSGLKTVDVKISNIYNKPVALQINMKAPEGWKLKKDTIPVKINSRTFAEVKFEIDETMKQAFNNYTFEITATDQTGNVLVNDKKPLDFPIAVENKKGIAPSEFTGDMSDWEDAYPIFVNPPDNPADIEPWRKSNIATRLYSKWDNEYFYFIADVNDDIFIQTFSKNAIWNNDSIQVSIDTKNDKATSYMKDDYEFGMALTGAGEEVWAYFNGEESYGERPSEWLKIIRDSTKLITRYYARIPLEQIAPLKPAHGRKFGFNIAINDADLVSRDSQIYFREGTGSPINPSLYETFQFIKSETKLKEGNAVPPVEVVVSQKYVETAPLFSDILGHWAQADIQSLASRDVVKGFDGMFYPESPVTRAEFLTLLLRAADIEPASYKGSYQDVDSGEWYAGIVQTAFDNGFIPSEMVAYGFLPDNPITREEMAAMACNVMNITNQAPADFLNRFSDKDSISEWAESYVSKIVRYGVMQGNEQSCFEPAANTTRAEAAAVIKRLYDKKNN